ncbi:hypothetical protein HMPREF3105_09445 [Micrococcus sp. HMSC31B01]|nr:hypothetical protein HMPREF3105_09445 [Micrococcus sp. HMSC31B01]
MGLLLLQGFEFGFGFFGAESVAFGAVHVESEHLAHAFLCTGAVGVRGVGHRWAFLGTTTAGG